jgi:hypothetical protein
MLVAAIDQIITAGVEVFRRRLLIQLAVPTLHGHFVAPLRRCLAVGMTIVAPFGKTDDIALIDLRPLNDDGVLHWRSR